MGEIKLLKPTSLDINEIIVGLKPPLVRHHDNVLFICNVITYSTISWGPNNLEDGFVNICSTQLKGVINDYKRYLDLLIHKGVLISDNQYIPGKKCMGYKFTGDYSPYYYEEVSVTDYLVKANVSKILDVEKSNFLKLKNKYPFLKWLAHVSVDIKNAQLILEEVTKSFVKEYKRIPEEVLKEANATKLTNQYRIDKIVNGDIYCSQDATGNRIHTTITQIKKELRRALRIKEQRLVSLDLKNSQPYFLNSMLRPQFWAFFNTSELRLDNIFPDYRKESQEDVHSIYNILTKELGKNADILRELEHYKQVTSNGRFYEMLIELFFQHGKKVVTREFVKKHSMYLFFANPKSEAAQKQGSINKIFQAEFPNIYRILYLIRKQYHNRTAIIMQRIESYCVLDIVCNKINSTKPEIPLLTVHDSIITTVGNEDYVANVMIKVLEKKITVAPRLEIDYL